METVRDLEKDRRDKDDAKSEAGKSQYQQFYAKGELKEKGMHMHDFLASDYDMENVVVTKTKLR